MRVIRICPLILLWKNPRKAGAKIDAVISAKAAVLGVSPYELLKTFRPKIESSIENKGGERFYVTMKISWELREP